jgi:NADH-quinone oxidoreductase subunit E
MVFNHYYNPNMGGGKMGDQQGNQPLEIDLSKVDEIIDNHNCDKELLISILQDIQCEFKYLPQNALIRVSKKLDLTLTQVYGVATFFKAFSLKPKGKHIINVCLGTACHVRAANDVLNRVEQELEIKNGETTQDMQFTLETVNCLGACALGPIMVVNGEYHGNMNPSQITNVLKKYSPAIDTEDEGSVDE